MTRRFLDDVRADIDSAISANGLGLITADVLRPLMKDMVDSTASELVVIGATTPTNNVTVTNSAWAVLPCNEARGASTQVLNINLADNSVTSSPTAGFIYHLIGTLSLTASRNSTYQLAILEDGIPVGFIGEITTQGGTRPVNVQARMLNTNTGASTKYQLAIKGISDASSSVDFEAVSMFATIRPTNNP